MLFSVTYQSHIALANQIIRRNIDLKIVSLNPIYADPDAASPNIYIGLHPIGSRGPDALLSFRGYNGESDNFHHSKFLDVSI